MTDQQTDSARDLRNVLLFGIVTSVVLGAVALIGVPTGILQIPLWPNVLVALAAFVVAVAGLAGLRFNWPEHELRWGVLTSWTALVTLAVHFTGGPQTPFPGLYVLIAVAASFLLGRSGAMLLAAFGLAGYALVLVLEYWGVLAMVPIWRFPFEPRGRELLLTINLLTVAIPTLVAASLAGTLAQRLSERNRQSNELRQQLSERLTSVQQTNRQLRALQISLSTFQSVLDLDETFTRITTAVCGLGYTVAYIAIFDEQCECLTIRASVTTLPAEAVQSADALAGHPLSGTAFARTDSDNVGVRAFTSGHIQVSQDLHDFYRPLTAPEVSRAIAQIIKFGCGASVPLRVEARPVGCLFAFASRPSLSEADLSLLQAFADQASVALERATLFAAVQRGRDQLQAVLNSTRDGIIMVDREGRLAMVNPATCELLELHMEELAGITLAEALTYLGVQARLDEAGIRSLQAEYADAHAVLVRRTFELLGPPHRFLELMSWPVSDQGGDTAGRLIVLHDVTHQKELEAAREEWAHMLVHDLRGPLGSIISGMYLVKDMVQAQNAEVAQRSAGLALEGAEHLLELINSLLDVYKLESGQMQLDMAPVDLAQLAAGSLRPFEAAAQGDGIRLIAEVGPDVPVVRADGGALQRVISNLVDNALKFTPRGGQVAVRACLGDGVVQISVADSGPGIPPDMRSQIFEKFATGKGQSGKRKGTGLGLSYCKLVVEAHGGQIWVDCPPEGGSVFAFTLPHAGKG